MKTSKLEFAAAVSTQMPMALARATVVNQRGFTLGEPLPVMALHTCFPAAASYRCPSDRDPTQRIHALPHTRSHSVQAWLAAHLPTK